MRVIVVLFFCVLWAPIVLSAPIDVLVFPGGAIVTEKTILTVNDGETSFYLPAAADPASLKINAENPTAILTTRSEIERLEVDDTALIKSINAAKDHKQELEDSLQYQTWILEYWQQQKGKTLETAADIQAIGETISQVVGPVIREMTVAKKQLAEVNIEIKELTERLRSIQGEQDKRWTIFLSLENASQKEEITYTYRVKNAAWYSIYTLDALTDKKQIDWSWRALVQQSTGVDWTDVNLSLATAEPVFTLDPPPVGSWIIRERQYYPAMKGAIGKQSLMAESMVAEDSVALSPARSEAKRVEGALFDVFEIGKRTLRAGENHNIKVQKGQWPATFSYLSRPIRSPQAFLSGVIELEDLTPLPSGQASILVDGIFVGKRVFALHEKKARLSFGNDPGVMIKVVAERQSDESGLISKDRVQEFAWTVFVTNNKKQDIDIEFEDATPQVQDGRVDLTPAIPQGSNVEDGVVAWSTIISPGKTYKASLNYRVKFPASLSIDVGR